MTEISLAPGAPLVADVLRRLEALSSAVRRAVAARRADDPAPDDPFRGLYVDDDEVDRLLDGDRPPLVLGSWAAADDGDSPDGRLVDLTRQFGLGPADVALLLVAMAPDVDSRFERFYGYLHDDVTRRRASVGLALELCGLHPTAAAARRRLGDTGPLVRGGLVVVDDADRPFLTRSLREIGRASCRERVSKQV